MINRFSIAARLATLVALLVGVAVAIGAAGIMGMHDSNSGLQTVYLDRVVPLRQLKQVSDAYAVSIIDAASKVGAGIITPKQGLESVESASGVITSNWREYRSTVLTPEETVLANEVEGLFSRTNEEVEALKQALTQPEGAQAAVAARIKPLYAGVDPVTDRIDKLVRLQLDVAKQEYDASTREYKALSMLILLCGGGGLLIACLTALAILRSVTAPLKKVEHALTAMAVQTAAAAHQVAASSEMLADGATEQAASLQESSASLEQMSSLIKRNSENATQARELAHETSDVVEEGARDVKAMHEAMDSIRESAENTARIVRDIDEISFQTNILALNAAVEAARAGEAGMGFAVVADEVRILAQRAAEAARESSERIEESSERTAAGVELAARLSKSLTRIVDKTKTVEKHVNEIAAASSEQAQGVGQINNAIGNMDRVTQTSASNAEETATAAQQLNSQVEQIAHEICELQRVIKGWRSETEEPAPDAAPEALSTGGRVLPKDVRRDRPALSERDQARISGPKSTASNSQEVLPMKAE